MANYRDRLKFARKSIFILAPPSGRCHHAHLTLKCSNAQMLIAHVAHADALELSAHITLKCSNAHCSLLMLLMLMLLSQAPTLRSNAHVAHADAYCSMLISHVAETENAVQVYALMHVQWPMDMVMVRINLYIRIKLTFVALTSIDFVYAVAQPFFKNILCQIGILYHCIILYKCNCCYQ